MRRDLNVGEPIRALTEEEEHSSLVKPKNLFGTGKTPGLPAPATK